LVPPHYQLPIGRFQVVEPVLVLALALFFAPATRAAFDRCFASARLRILAR
jgi:hypothetical protein